MINNLNQPDSHSLNLPDIDILNELVLLQSTTKDFIDQLLKDSQISSFLYNDLIVELNQMICENEKNEKLIVSNKDKDMNMNMNINDIDLNAAAYIENNLDIYTKNVCQYFFGLDTKGGIQQSACTLNSILTNITNTNPLIDNLNDTNKRKRSKKIFYIKKIKSKSNCKEIPKKNHMNRSSNFRGVSKNGLNWQVLIMLNKKLKYFGCFKTQEEAALVYDILGIKYQGNKTKTNFMYTNEEIEYIKENDLILNMKSKSKKENI